jgi:multidrug efflux pump subunit AcrB
VEIPGGGIESDSGEFLLRVADRRKTGVDFENILIQGTASGYTVRLGDIATVSDGYADTKQDSFFNGKPAVRVVSYRVGNETPTNVATAVKEFAANFKEQLPPTVSISTLKDSSEVLEGRIDLLMRNALTGLFMVLIVLALFLDLSLAGWIALGIPISFMGAFLLMPGFGLSINMVTLFAFIVTLGMVVDDAIIVGENIQQHINDGMPRLDAAITGANQMAKPVTFSILTTVAAFGPLFLVPGFMGKIFGLIPSIVVAVLLFSLVESFFVLPAHLARTSGAPLPKILAPLERLHLNATAKLRHFNLHIYQPLLKHVLKHRYFAVAVAMSLLIVCLGAVGSGLIPFNFFPKLEGNEIRATARLPYGVPIEHTQKIQQELEKAWEKAVEQSGEPHIVRGVYTTLGKTASHRGQSETGSHVVSIEVNLVPTEQRTLSAAQLSDLWTNNTPPLPGVEALTYNSSSGPGAGAAVNVQLTHRDPEVLATASARVANALHSFKQLKNVENTYAAGKPQLDFHILPLARTLGVTGNDVARQMRAAFFGAEALREQRGRNEVRVMVRLPKAQRTSEYDLETLPIRAPNGTWIPLNAVARFERGRAATTIRREDGKRIVNVEAELAPGVKSPREVLTTIQTELFPSLRRDYPNLGLEFTGSQRDQAESLSSLGPNYILALFIIFTLLAIPFGSYLQPLIIMAAIPFGFVGAILGHVVMGYGLSVISMFGVIALSGVVVNDSLVLIDATNGARERGMSPFDAIVWGGSRRLRPILLTSLTTFFGLAPMILETSFQARFLIPMAISLGFGVLFATFIVLLIIPSLYLITEDIKAVFTTKKHSTTPQGTAQTAAPGASVSKTSP